MSADVGAVRMLPEAGKVRVLGVTLEANTDREILIKKVVTMKDVIFMIPSVASGLPGLQGRICNLSYGVFGEKE